MLSKPRQSHPQQLRVVFMSEQDRIRWDQRYRDWPVRAFTEPEPFLVAMSDHVPTRGRALDVAGGLGGNSVWLATRGLYVTLADISEEALRLATERAVAAAGSLSPLRIDLEETACPAGPWELIVVVRYLHRPLFGAFAREIARDGLLVVVHPTVRNLERFDRPSRRWLLGEGELVGLLDGWEIVHHEEGWADGPPGQHEARCLARRPTDRT